MSPMNNTAVVFVSLVAAFIFLSSVNGASVNRLHLRSGQLTYPLSYGNPRSVVEIEDPEYVLELLQKLGASIIRANELEKKLKRNQMIDVGLSGAQAGKRVQMLDLGLGRGFSGAQAGKHLIGLLAASAAGGPGRRRRSLELPEMHLQHQTQSYNLPTADNTIDSQNAAR